MASECLHVVERCGVIVTHARSVIVCVLPSHLLHCAYIDAHPDAYHNLHVHVHHNLFCDR